MTDRGWKGLPAWVVTDAQISRERDLIYVPYFASTGELHNRRVFADNGRCWWETRGRELILFGLERLFPPHSADRHLYICEGESDALALREHIGWAHDVVGLPGASSWRPEWRQHLEPWAVVYLLGDGDHAGRAMNARIRGDVPWARPVWLPDGEDVRSIVQRRGFYGLEPHVGEADWYANAAAALKLARTVEEFDALMRGEDVDLSREVDRAA